MTVCKLFRPLTPGLKINCGNCAVWVGTKCDNEEKLLREIYKMNEFVGMMKHDSFERGRSGIRQIGWG